MLLSWKCASLATALAKGKGYQTQPRHWPRLLLIVIITFRFCDGSTYPTQWGEGRSGAHWCVGLGSSDAGSGRRPFCKIFWEPTNSTRAFRNASHSSAHSHRRILLARVGFIWASAIASPCLALAECKVYALWNQQTRRKYP